MEVDFVSSQQVRIPGRMEMMYACVLGCKAADGLFSLSGERLPQAISLVL